MINRYPLFCYLFIYIFSQKKHFTSIRDYNYDIILNDKRNFINKVWNSSKKTKNNIKGRFLYELKNDTLHFKKVFGLKNKFLDKSNNFEGNIVKIKGIDRMMLNKLIISFKNNNFLSLQLLEKKIMDILPYCGRLKKLDYINYYLYDFFKELNKFYLKVCVRLLQSKWIHIEMDYEIQNIETKDIYISKKNISTLHDKPVSKCGAFKPSNASIFKFHFNKKLNSCNRTNIIKGYDVVRIKEAMELVGSREVDDVNVCIIDTGIDYNHIDLKDNIIEMKSSIRKKTENGAILDSEDNSIDEHGHGTFIAGIIAGNSPHGKGIKGISRKSKLIICKALNNNNSGYMSDILECLNFCAEKKAKIINASFASRKNYPDLYKALRKLEEKNILVITSSGNCSSENSEDNCEKCNLDVNRLYPSGYSKKLNNLISVSNMIQHPNGDITLAPSSCYSNNYVHLAAPGSNIKSTLPYNMYGKSSGSSFSAALITGFASLLLSINSKLTCSQIIEKFKNSIIPVKSLQDKVKWGGVINAYNLIESIIE